MSYIKISENIIICPNQGAGFESAICDALKTIESKPVGKRLLEKIKKSTHVVWLTAGNESKTTFYHALGAITKGEGSDAEVSLSLIENAMIGIDAQPIPSSFFIDFAHELIHVYRGFYGKNKTLGNRVDRELWQDDDEYETMVGFPCRKDKQREKVKITENAIREEHGLPLVYTHRFASVLNSPVLKREIELHCLAHRTASFFQELLESSEFRSNPAQFFSINSGDELKNAKGSHFSLIRHLRSTPTFSSPPVVGKIYKVSSQKLKAKDL